MFYVNNIMLTNLIRIFLVLYYINFNNFSRLISLIYKFSVLFNYVILTCYSNYNKNLLLKNFITIDKNNKFKSKLYSQILTIKIIAKTTKNIIIRRFSIISIIGNKTHWLGIGKAKHKNLDRAVKNSYKNAFSKIIYFPVKILNPLYLNIKFKKTNLIIYKYNCLNTNVVNLNNMFNLIGFFIKSKIIGVSANCYNLLNIYNKLGHISIC